MDATADQIGLTVEVVGAMNPAIHTPWWYREHHILPIDRAPDSVAQRSLVVVPGFVQFQTEQLAITCDLDRWQATTQTQASWDHVVELACATFKHLEHTPARGISLSYAGHIATGWPSPRQRLGQKLTTLDVGFPETEVDVVRLEGEWSSGQTRYSLRLEPSKRQASRLFVRVSASRDLAGHLGGPGQEPAEFDLPGGIRAAYAESVVVARARFAFAQRMGRVD